jgi:hypothetical protein
MAVVVDAASGWSGFGYWPKAERSPSTQTTVSKNERGALHQNPYSFLKIAVVSATSRSCIHRKTIMELSLYQNYRSSSLYGCMLVAIAC